FKRTVDLQVSKRESFLSTMHSLERLGEVCEDAGLSFSVATHLASTITALSKFGSSELKELYMDNLIEGRIIGAHAISEPGAGSDALSMTTTATESGDYYILNGHKAFVTNGSIADVIIVYAKTSDSSSADCVSAFLIDTRSEGIELGPTMETVGLQTSPLCELKLTNCRVPKTHMVGREGAGFFVLSHVMQREILFAFIISIGEMKRRLK
ncbi:acyl-CoA dehydrogenase, partial [Vibrio cholerae]|nr:acyl-CoA dehydrogenase [Vibrio cholerae]